MKAIVHTKFGPPDELTLREIDKPTPGDKEVLIKIHATTVTSTDCNARNFTFVTRVFQLPARLFFFGLFKPRINILGIDLAGVIEAVGKDVKRFKPGDQVFGSPGIKFGAHAEYACVPEDGPLTIKPPGMTWKQAAALFLGGSTALYFLRDRGDIQAGQKILIYGASGAIGTYAVQLAKYFGARVTGVCSRANLGMVKSLGADRVIDYTKEDVTRSGDTYDLVLDTVGKTSFSRCKHLLTPKGVFLAVSMGLAEVIQMGWTPLLGGRQVRGGVAPERVEDLEFLKEVFTAGKLIPVIDRCYPLEQTAAAFAYVEKGHKKGNVVITLDHGDKGYNQSQHASPALTAEEEK